MPIEKLLKRRDVPFELYEIDLLNADDNELEGISGRWVSLFLFMR